MNRPRAVAIYYQETFWNSKVGVGWVAFSLCGHWAHDACAGVEEEDCDECSCKVWVPYIKRPTLEYHCFLYKFLIVTTRCSLLQTIVFVLANLSGKTGICIILGSTSLRNKRMLCFINCSRWESSVNSTFYRKSVITYDQFNLRYLVIPSSALHKDILEDVFFVIVIHITLLRHSCHISHFTLTENFRFFFFTFSFLPSSPSNFLHIVLPTLRRLNFPICGWNAPSYVIFRKHNESTKLYE